MRIIETPTFTRQISALMADDDYRTVQLELAANPQVGEIIPRRWGNPQAPHCSTRHGKTRRRTAHLLLAKRSQRHLHAAGLC